MDFATVYGKKLGTNFIEVHHLKPISSYETDGVPENFVDNLIPLCSNCHSMIHHINDSEYPLRDLREAYKGEKKTIKIKKADKIARRQDSITRHQQTVRLAAEIVRNRFQGTGSLSVGYFVC